MPASEFAKGGVLDKRTRQVVSQPDPPQLNYPISTGFPDMLLNNALVSADLKGAILDGTITETMDGASTVEFTYEDPNRKLTSTLLKDWVSVSEPVVYKGGTSSNKVVLPRQWNDVYLTVDGRDFALVQASKQGYTYDLTFESRAIHEMRKISKPRTWDRSVYTRAEVILSMCQEVTNYPVALWSPELTKVQTIATSKDAPTESEKKARKGKGFAPKAKVTVKGSKASPGQLAIEGRVLTVGESMKASYKVMVCAIMTITQESTVSLLDEDGNYGPFSQRRNGAWPASVTDVEADAHAFFVQAIRQDQSDPNQSYDELCQNVQGSAYPLAYGQWQKEAEATVKAWGSGTGSSTISFTEFNKYLFRRGQNGKRETSWVCGTRLAQEVNWQLFAVDNTLFYVKFNDLLLAMPFDTISEDDEGIDSIDYEIDTGKTLSQATVTAHVGRWKCPPGTPVFVEDNGPSYGRWIVQEVERPIFSDIATITLELPTPAKAEPAPSTKTISVSGNEYTPNSASSGSEKVDAAWEKAVDISRQNYPYVWGGGHTTIGEPDGGTSGGAIGFDCSGYASAILHAAGWLNSPEASGSLENWGVAGEGKIMTVWASAGHVFIEFKFPYSSSIKPRHQRADTVPSGDEPDGPHTRPVWPPPEPDWPSAFVARHWPGT